MKIAKQIKGKTQTDIEKDTQTNTHKQSNRVWNGQKGTDKVVNMKKDLRKA